MNAGRLIWFRVNGYGRFETATANLDAKVIAILGANESGKTSFLSALEELDSGVAIDARRLTRGFTSDEPVCEAWFLLDKAERESIAETTPDSEPPLWYVLEKYAAGKRVHRLRPSPERSLGFRKGLLNNLDEVGETVAPVDQSEFDELIASAAPSEEQHLDKGLLDRIAELAVLRRPAWIWPPFLKPCRPAAMRSLLN